MITHNRIPNDLRVVNYKKKQEKDTKHIEIQGVKCLSMKVGVRPQSG